MTSALNVALRPVFLLVALRATAAHAQSQGTDVPLGGRSTLLGGTGVALGRDGAAPFLNPATLGHIADHRIAFSVNFYRYQRGAIDDVFRAPSHPQLPSASYESSSFAAVPSSFCAFVTLAGLIPSEARGLLQTVRGSSGRTKLGLCGASIERETIAFDAETRKLSNASTTALLANNLESSWQRQTFGPSLSYQLTQNLTLGVSLQWVTTKARSSTDLAALVGDEDGYVHLKHLDASSTDGATTLGLVYDFAPLTWGLSVRLPSISFYDSARVATFSDSPSTSPTLSAGSGHLSAPLPPFIAFGTGYQSPLGSFEFDVATNLGHPQAVVTALSEDGSLGTRSRGHQESMRPSVAFRVGGEWFYSPRLSLLAGARYEPSLLHGSLTDAAYRLGPTPSRRIAGSLGVGSYGHGTELLLGIELSSTVGTLPLARSAADGDTYLNTSYSQTAVLLVLSGSVGLSAVRQTWTNLRQVTPALPRPSKPN